MDTPDIRITVNGQPAYTIEQAAHAHGMKPSSMRAAITRAAGAIREAAKLDGRKPLYLAADLDHALRRRPGRGHHA